MKVTETINRECCQQKDLKPVEGSRKFGQFSEYMFCIYCGHRHEHHRVIDAAGGYDNEYEKIKEPWEWE